MFLLISSCIMAPSHTSLILLGSAWHWNWYRSNLIMWGLLNIACRHGIIGIYWKWLQAFCCPSYPGSLHSRHIVSDSNSPVKQMHDFAQQSYIWKLRPEVCLRIFFYIYIYPIYCAKITIYVTHSLGWVVYAYESSHIQLLSYSCWDSGCLCFRLLFV